MSMILWMSLRRGISGQHYVTVSGLVALDLTVVVETRPGQEIIEHLLDRARVAFDVPAEVGEPVDDAPLDASRLLLRVRQELEQRLARRFRLLVTQEALDGDEADAFV